jgi:hypothetical protein
VIVAFRFKVGEMDALTTARVVAETAGLHENALDPVAEVCKLII